MRLSIYTCVRNGIHFDFHVAAMLRHHLPFADEIIVNEGMSTDETYERILEIGSSKIKVFRSEWGQPNDFGWFCGFKDAARRACTGDWCINLDCDEFIPEWEFDTIRRAMEVEREPILPLGLVNFYGNYRVYHRRPESVGWPAWKAILHQNRPDIQVVGDGSNVSLAGVPARPARENVCDLHHFGFVRHPARLREKWRNIQGHMHRNRKRGTAIPSFLFDLRPHDWTDPTLSADLALYDGPFIEAVRRDPNEFVRDDWRLLQHLNAQPAVT
jgi:glycosyltransferase involved in cell wall biosynthesis